MRSSGVAWARLAVLTRDLGHSALPRRAARRRQALASTQRNWRGLIIERLERFTGRVLELAAELAETTPLPLMLTGGITRRETAEAALASGVALIGMGTAIALTPDLSNRWRSGHEATERPRPVTWSDKTLASAAGMALVRHQMRRITRGRRPTGNTHPLYALACDQRAQRRALGRYRQWLEARA